MDLTWKIWFAHLRRWGRRCLRLGRADVRPTGSRGVAQLGHRDYVGGRWEEIGRLQFDFLKANGLRPEHVLLDVACGALRAGIYLIPYLNPGHYWGLEKEQSLVDAGLNIELPSTVRETQQPQFLINAGFDVTGMTERADFIWMHSLLTHLPPATIRTALERVRAAAHAETVCFATYFRTATTRNNIPTAHDHETFFYTLEELTACATAAGWTVHDIGDWGHPRGQSMVRLRVTEQGGPSH